MNKISFDDLKNKVCAITGGGGIIGNAICEALASAGVKIAVLDIDPKLAEKTASEIRNKYSVEVVGIQSDVLDKNSLEKTKTVINDKLGKVNLLINCAGGNSPKATTKVEFIEKQTLNFNDTFFGLELEGFQKVFDLNFLGTILPTMVLTRDMIEIGSGAILNISSMNSFRPLTKIPAYSAAKAAINNFTQWLAVHLAKVNVRVNAIAPGFFLTNQNRFLLIDEKTGNLTERGQKIINSTPMGKFGDPEDLKGISLFLLSDLSKFITGVVVPIDGGFSAYSGV